MAFSDGVLTESYRVLVDHGGPHPRVMKFLGPDEDPPENVVEKVETLELVIDFGGILKAMGSMAIESRGGKAKDGFVAVKHRRKR